MLVFIIYLHEKWDPAWIKLATPLAVRHATDFAISFVFANSGGDTDEMSHNVVFHLGHFFLHKYSLRLGFQHRHRSNASKILLGPYIPI